MIDRNGEPIAVLGPAPSPAAVSVDEFAEQISDLEFPGGETYTVLTHNLREFDRVPGLSVRTV